MKAATGRCWSVLQGLLILLVAVVFGVAPALAQAPAAKKEPAATKPVAATAKAEPVRTAEPAAKPPGSPEEGIKVHGHWVIEVRNPDGTVAGRREFENALVSSGLGGSLTLAQTLGRSISVGFWSIFLSGGVCLTPVANIPQDCVIQELADAANSNITAFLNLSIETPTSGANANKLVLRGTATAGAAGQITAVETSVKRCPPNVALGPPCPNFAFSGTTLAGPINVSTGQIIQVTVLISFS